MKLKKKELDVLNNYFKACNYISACELYLLDNPLLKRELKITDIKKKLVGHWGTVPGQNFIYTHLNRLICQNNLDMIYVSGPGHGGNFFVANTYLEGSFSEKYPDITMDEEGLKKLFKEFSFPGGLSSHVAPEVPGSINEGGELGYSLVHAYGAVLDNPNLIACCVVGDGEAETGPLATSWHLNKFLNPCKDGWVLPILHLNGYKIANPSILARISKEELISLFYGYGYEPIIVEGNSDFELHEKMANALDNCLKKIKTIQYNYRVKKRYKRELFPLIILKTKKGWTGPKVVEGNKIENSFRAHQIPLIVDNDHLDNLIILENWLRSYKPDQLFDEKGSLKKEYQLFIPKGDKRMGSSPYTNGGLLLKDLKLPNLKDYEVKSQIAEDTRQLGIYLKDVIKLNKDNFRIFGPDEALSNRLNSIFEETNRQFEGKIYKDDDYLNNEGRIIDSFLSEHVCEGLLEGYILSGRWGLFNSYEAFIRIVDSMVSQHAKWLKVANELKWREPIASLNLLLTSHIWQQDHNGFTHQDPGFLNHLVTKKAEIVRIYLPADSNTLLLTMEHALKSKNYINVIIASKHPSYQWLSMDEALIHTQKGLSIWNRFSDSNPDLVISCCGDTPTIEAIVAREILKAYYPKLKIRLVNVVDLMKLVSFKDHPHGLTDEEYNNIFTKDKPIIFAFHGYPTLVHELTYKRKNQNMHVYGYHEEGTITTPFDMRVQNKLDRYHLVLASLKYLPNLKDIKLTNYCHEMLTKHHDYIKKEGIDMPEVKTWQFNPKKD